MEKRGEMVTLVDLEQFRRNLLRDIKRLLQGQPMTFQKPWLKSHEVQRLLKISSGTLQHLRDSGAIKFSRVGGIIFYRLEEIEKMVKEREE